MMGDVVLAGAVTALTGDAQEHVVAAEPIGGAGGVRGPGVMALQAARVGLARERRLGSVAPAVERREPADGMDVEPIVLPGEVHFIAFTGRAVDEVDPVGMTLL